MSFQPYNLDRIAQKLVLEAKQRDKESLNQSYKMRMATAYGLERFWGEHLRLKGKDRAKSDYWKQTWDAFVETMDNAGISIPNRVIQSNETSQVLAMSEELWGLDRQDQQVALAVLIQLCDCLVWWTQRHK